MSLTVLKYFLSGLDTNHPYVWLVIVLQLMCWKDLSVDSVTMK